MRRIIIIVISSFCTAYFCLAQDFKNELDGFLQCSFSFEQTSALGTQITYEITEQSKEKFAERIRRNLNTEIFPNYDSMSYDDILAALKKEINIFKFTSGELCIFNWSDCENLSYSLMYSQNISGRMYGAGVFVFRVFKDDVVYTIRISDQTDIQEHIPEYDAMDDILFFKSGQKMDALRGIEGNQGYYMVSKSAAEEFCNRLEQKDSRLPDSALRFYEAKEYIETFLDTYHCK